MEGFASSFLNSKPSSISFIADIDHNMELLLNPFAIQYHDNDQLNTSSSSNSSHQSFMGFTNDNNFFSQPLVDHHQFLQSFQLPVFQDIEKKNVMMINNPESAAAPTVGRVVMNGKRKAAMDVSSTTNSGNSSTHPLPEINEIDEKKYQSSGGKGKKVKLNQINGETSKEVVHVRARRGQATDSHSIAERVRRGKINERLRCLQDIVPGCYKSMGMAVMLDEIINYVQSLQNQVEFLSMKLTEASRFHSFDSDLMHMDVLQMGNVIEGLRMQRLEEREEIGPVDQSFGSYPSLPYHTT